MTLEQRYPNKRARQAADEACDDLSNELSMEHHLSVWIDTYYKTTKTLPVGQHVR
jgi:hypothetical protein